MFDRVWELVGANLALDTVALSGWAVPAVATFVLMIGTLAFFRKGIGGLMVRVAVTLIMVWASWLWLDNYLTRRELAAEQRAFEARAFELATVALAPGSALACLDAIAGEVVEDPCEKELFASPGGTAGAVSYVAAQLSLLDAAAVDARSGGRSFAMTTLRRALEADRFGIVAHVLAVRDGCTPDQCSAFSLLRDAGRISANLSRRRFESYVEAHMASWQAEGNRPAAGTPGAAAAAPIAATKVPNNLFLPSSASIPPVSIMTAEPAPSQRAQDKTQAKPRNKSQNKPHAATAATEASVSAPSTNHSPTQPTRLSPSAGSVPARPVPSLELDAR
jgi:hypothetical protein